MQRVLGRAGAADETDCTGYVTALRWAGRSGPDSYPLNGNITADLCVVPLFTTLFQDPHHRLACDPRSSRAHIISVSSCGPNSIVWCSSRCSINARAVRLLWLKRSASPHAVMSTSASCTCRSSAGARRRIRTLREPLPEDDRCGSALLLSSTLVSSEPWQLRTRCFMTQF